MTTPKVSAPQEYKYWAFISYSHKDKKWADWLHWRREMSEKDH